MRRSAINGVLYEDLPAVRSLLERIEIKSYQVIEKVTFYLASEDIYL